MKDKTDIIRKSVFVSCLTGVGFLFFMSFGIVFLLFATCGGLMLPDWLDRTLGQTLRWIFGT